MLDSKVSTLLNEQVNKEFYSAYLYLDFANYFVDKNLDGFANWYQIQAQEERDHALLFIKYMQNNGIPVTLGAIDAPAKDITSIIDPPKFSLDHEKYVTASIHNIYAEAMAVKDFRTMQFLDWFIEEQAEEETSADALLKKVEMFGSNPQSLYLLDQEMGTRVYTAPSLTL